MTLRQRVIGAVSTAGQLGHVSRLPSAHPSSSVGGGPSADLVQKAVAAGVGALIAVGAPTSLSADLAKQSGLALYGFTSQRRTVRYS